MSMGVVKKSDCDLANLNRLKLALKKNIFKCWLTTQWPPRINSDDKHDRVRLAKGRRSVGKKLDAGDIVFIYQSKSGPKVQDRYINEKRSDGKIGVIIIATIKNHLIENTNNPLIAIYRKKRVYWSWEAEIEIEGKNGFVCADKINRILTYKPGYNFRGFGTRHSGLKMLTNAQGRKLLSLYIMSLRK